VALNASAAGLQKDVSELHTQIQKGLAVAEESAARHQQIVQLTALVRHHEEESANRYQQIVELTVLARQYERENAACRAQFEPRLALVESELTAYLAENDRLAKELDLTRKALAALPARGPELVRLPRSVTASDDIVYHIDRCEAGDRLLCISGWAFCPRIDCGVAVATLLLNTPEENWLARLQPVLRPDVASTHAQTDFGPHLPIGGSGRRQLAQCGFTGLWGRPPLAPGQACAIAIQIDGPDFSVRRSTEIVLHG